MNKAEFLGEESADFTINKANFSENTLVYANQGNVTPGKGDLTIYLDYVILEQLIPARISPEDIEEYECLPNEVKLVVPLYDVGSGKFVGLGKRLAFIMVRVTKTKHFFHMVMIKLKQIHFILPLKKYYLTYLVEPVLKKMKIFCWSNE